MENKEVSDKLVKDYMKLFQQTMEWYKNTTDATEADLEAKDDLIGAMSKIKMELDCIGMGVHISQIMQQQQSNIVVPQGGMAAPGGGPGPIGGLKIVK